jgi:lipopolysaccharide transport system ATP-binding protein
MSVVVRVENVSKKYHLGKIGTQTMRGDLQRWWARRRGKDDPFAKLDQRHQPAGADFWALQEVNFEISQGQAVGIIGRNGAGKSTILKILSRITLPTTGRVRIRGRIASLLEVGTGFNPELTGRENIFLNGAILGMSKAEVKRKFDEIVNFSGVEQFIDTPVKRYSSGMYVRLAFAVAAHLESEILILDEVLAVGDAEFQKKCLGKMDDVAHKEGRTVIFVSHDITSVRRLCNRAILFEKGRITQVASADQVADSYLAKKLLKVPVRQWHDAGSAPGNGIVRLLAVWLHDANHTVTDTFDITQPIGVSMQYQVLQDGDVFTHTCSLHNDQGVNIFNSHDVTSPVRLQPRTAGTYTATMWIPGNLLAEGYVSVGVAIIKVNPFLIYLYELDVLSFSVEDHIRGDSARGNYTLGFPGIVRPLLQWQTQRKELLS